MHTIRLPLKTTEYDRQQMERRFRAVSHIHNVAVKQSIRLLQKLKFHTEYRSCLAEYKELLKKQKLSAGDKKRKTELSGQMKSILKDIGLTEYGLQSCILPCARQYKKLLSSQQIQKEASRVYRGVEKVLFGNGKWLHFKKYADFDTICGKSNKNGAKFHKETMSVEWLGLYIPCKLPKRDTDYDYMKESLSHDISYCEIERKMFNNGWHYYAVVYLKGDAPRRLDKTGTSIMGIDPGTSTVAGVSDTAVFLEELAPRAKEYDRQIYKLQQKMERSRRAMNPDKYHEDGTVNRQNKEKWVYSNTYHKDRRKLKTLYRKKAAYIRQDHEARCNRFLRDSCTFLVERMAYQALQKRAGTTARQDNPAAVVQKDGSVKEIRKYKKKKRFGKSLNSRAPALFLTILKRKCEQYGGSYMEVNTNTFKASQYNHVTDMYERIPLSQRSKQIGGHTVQRDLYSAFLIRNADSSLEHTDRESCIYGFERFASMQNELTAGMKASGIHLKQCFGF